MLAAEHTTWALGSLTNCEAWPRRHPAATNAQYQVDRGTLTALNLLVCALPFITYPQTHLTQLLAHHHSASLTKGWRHLCLSLAIVLGEKLGRSCEVIFNEFVICYCS